MRGVRAVPRRCRSYPVLLHEFAGGDGVRRGDRGTIPHTWGPYDLMAIRPPVASVLTCACLLTVSGAAQQSARDPFCPPGYAAVADSVAAQFDTHQFVFMGSTHGWKKQHDFQICLLSRQAFHRRATDVMVEWANPVHQRLVDRYLLKLESMSIDSLAPAWIDTDAPDLWGRLTLMPAFYEAVRAMNEQLEPAHRIRVIGGNEPVDWSRVKTQEDVARYPYKGNWAAHVIMEHYAPDPSRRLFVIYGEGHVNRRGAVTAEARLKVSLDQWFMVGVIRERGEDHNLIARLGDPAGPFYAGTAKLPTAPPYPRDLSVARQEPLASVMNAVVYLGPEPDRSMSHTVDLTRAQLAEVARRDQIKGDLKQLMQLRYGSRAEWYRTHPRDIPARDSFEAVPVFTSAIPIARPSHPRDR